MILILGGGPTGLGAAYKLSKLGVDDWTLVEHQNQAGGLASSFRDRNGFTWDLGGHVGFSHYPEYDAMVDEVLGNDRIWHTRKSLIRISDRLIPYPFQYNLHRLNPSDRRRALAALETLCASGSLLAKPPSNFREWIYETYGSGIAELFMVPYNEKVWGYPLELLNCAWVGDRVPAPDLERVRRNVDLGCDDADWGGNSTFWYPRLGGTGATWRNLFRTLDPCKVHFGVAVQGIDLASRTAHCSNGETLKWDTLISTIPLDDLCTKIVGLQPEIQRAARSLLHSSCHTIGIGCRGSVPAALAGVSWIYFPSASVPHYRVTVLSNYSPHNAPEGCWSLLAEVCETAHAPVVKETLAGNVLAALRLDGLIPADVELVSDWYRFTEYGYPTPSLARDAALERILPALEVHGVFSRGRFGAWKYEVSNQDHSFMQGVELIERLNGCAEEVTVWHPEQVNQTR
jgi:protoporphyrinogen oxidase